MSKKKRSYLMSTIRSKNTRPEVVLRLLLRSMGKRYRLDSKLSGRPDIKLIGEKTVIFVDGCFWHGCPYHYKLPSSNTSFWFTKVTTNRARDKRNKRKLQKEGYRVIRVWEHELENPLRLKVKLERLLGNELTDLAA